RGLAARPGGGQRVGQAGEEDVEAALELGGAVVGGQGGGKAAQQGEFADRQPVQAQPQQVVGLVWVLDEFLQLVQDVAVQESEQGPVDVQGVGSAEPGACEQGQDVLERAQGAGGAEPERGGERPCDQQRHYLRVGQCQRAVAAGHGTQLPGPVGIGRVHLELGENRLGYAVEQGR